MSIAFNRGSLVRVLLVLTLTHTVMAAPNDTSELAGLLHNETTSRSGQEFYDEFSSVWLLKGHTATLRIVETLASQGQTILSVYVNSLISYQTRLGLRANGLDTMAAAAADQVEYYLLRNALVKRSDVYY